MPLRSLLRKLRDNTRGNFATTFALIAVPLMAVTGAAVDYTMALRTTGALQEAADSAVMAGAVLAMEGASKKEQRKEANTFFKGVCSSSECNLVTGKKVIADGKRVRMELTADSPISFLQLAGISGFPVKVVSEASVSEGHTKFVDVYFLVDISGSMNIADGKSQIKKLQSLFSPYDSKDGCAFACHEASDGTNATLEKGLTGFEVSRKYGVYLREDRVRDEMSEFAKTILTSPSWNARVGIHNFQWSDVNVIDPQPQNGQVQKAIKNLEFSSGGTSVEYALNGFSSKLPKSGSGDTAGDPRVVMVLITDGMTQDPSTGEYEPLNTVHCDTIKAKGATLMVLNVEYPDLKLLKQPDNPSVLKAKKVIDKIEAPLKSCASSGYYYKGDYAGSVSAAFDDILEGLKELAKADMPVFTQ